ncbi:Oidioi.mRNA.OKI2018_I69.chr1.g1410.t1.cds [Oikopleura dioica]|uniref:Oidioi.mRNA.OKI2018_I69.chr1.g1410.t1.cds n=1 Tax=Oikopleura dioica TaxID=34765 RepID=A0ABN7SNC0_OIKDI|nr:Oidioi.mRNA.OKI2018_I69.chr1.g1410.t1.cds [Oikopleura dioica]
MNQVDFEETGAQVHSGFYECFMALKPKVENFLDRTLKVADSEKQVDEILFVGHSLGGAIASLMGMSLAPKYEKETLNFRVVSVGAPKIGNQALQNLFKQRVKKQLRIRLDSDIIVDSPPLLYWFRNSGNDADETDYPIFDVNDFAFASHMPESYLKGIERNKQVILKKKFENAVQKAKTAVKKLTNSEEIIKTAE